MDMLIIVGLFLLGLVFGSFVNAWVWRLGKQLDANGDPKKLTNAQKQQYSITKGRSMCPSCKHQLAPKDLVPLISWLSLKGKCRYCKAKISKQYLLVELAMAIMFVVSYIFWPVNLPGSSLILLIGFIATLVPLFALAIYDYKHFILPDKVLIVGIIIYSVFLFIYAVALKDFFIFGMSVLAGVLYFAIFLSIFIASLVAQKKGYTNKDWLGLGDVKLVFLLGLMIGKPTLVIIGMFLASMLGFLVNLPSLISKKETFGSQIPFGPYLIAGAIITILFGQIVLNWYTNILINSI